MSDLRSSAPTSDNVLKVLEPDAFEIVKPVDDRFYDNLKLLQELFSNLDGSSLDKYRRRFSKHRPMIQKIALSLS